MDHGVMGKGLLYETGGRIAMFARYPAHPYFTAGKTVGSIGMRLLCFSASVWHAASSQRTHETVLWPRVLRRRHPRKPLPYCCDLPVVRCTQFTGAPAGGAVCV